MTPRATLREMQRWAIEDVRHGQWLIREARRIKDPAERAAIERRGLYWIERGERWAERAIHQMAQENGAA